jgi:hypothetical protein
MNVKAVPAFSDANLVPVEQDDGLADGSAKAATGAAHLHDHGGIIAEQDESVVQRDVELAAEGRVRLP